MRFKLTAISALALIPSLVVAQQTTSDTTMRDTTMRDTTYTTTSEGSLAAPSANLGLTTEQVKELQKAINDNGCHAGEVTGTITDATREGIQCIRESKNIEGTDVNDVLKALGLSFTVSTLALAGGLAGRGAFRVSALAASTLCTLPALAGMGLGQLIRSRVNARVFRRLFLICLLGIGAELIGRGVFCEPRS